MLSFVNNTFNPADGVNSMVILYGILIFGLVIFIHELGHFFIGKLVGIKFSTLSIGLGPRLLKVKIGDTYYCLSVFPIGGYVRSNVHKETPVKKKILIFDKIAGFLAPFTKEEATLSQKYKSGSYHLQTLRTLSAAMGEAISTNGIVFLSLRTLSAAMGEAISTNGIPLQEIASLRSK